MRLKRDSSEQKLRGAYYTPLQLADAMVELLRLRISLPSWNQVAVMEYFLMRYRTLIF